MQRLKNNWKLNFFLIWSGQAMSLITSAVLQMAIIWYLTYQTGSALVLSMATLAGFLPQAILGPFIGVLVDRCQRKLIMIGADLLIAAAGGVLALLTLFMELPVWVILLVLFIRSVGSAFHSPALSAVTPLLVPTEQLTRCAGYTQSIQSVSYILSPALAAMLYSIWSLNAIIAMDVLGALAACITVAAAVIPELEKQDTVEKTSMLLEMKEGYEALRKQRGLFTLLWIGAFYMLIYMPINALFPLMSISYFGGTAVHASAVEMAFAAGMLLGGVLLGLWGGFQRKTLMITASILLMGASLSLAGILPESGFAFFLVLSLLMGFSGPFYSGVQIALFQERIQPEYLGRVFALLTSVVSFSMPLGLLLSGAFADRIGVSIWFLLSGILILVLGIVTLLIPAYLTLDKK
ncbi:MFS transporter [Anoxybacterium hadale]|uniref:MFS transporter n=1 Tax=Anoxybacterium hadale TaxID=3408580 RepID=A0ACD1A7Q2_9FIRM|nr:MFS transporter [Clostridiales bacterium]